jgi:hypothetical protein
MDFVRHIGHSPRISVEYLHYFVPLSSSGKSGALEAVSVFRRVQEFLSCFLHFTFVVLFK